MSNSDPTAPQKSYVTDENGERHITSGMIIDGHSYLGIDSQVSVGIHTDEHGNQRLADHLIGLTPPADERRFLAITQRKVDMLELEVSTLLLEAHQYPNIDQRHLNIARTNIETGLMFLSKALQNVEIVDDGK